ncbi:MAG: FHA domain-containing protein [Actinomycetota bacterium]
MRAHYWPASSGGWLGFVAPARVLLVGHEPDEAARDELWTALGTSKTAQDLLERLTSGGIASTPPFALLEFESGGVRAFVRGEVTVRGELPSGSSTASGAGVSTWAECLFSAPSRLAVTIEGSATLESPGRLSIQQGVTLVAALELEPGGPLAPPDLAGHDYLSDETQLRSISSVSEKTDTSPIVAELRARRRADAKRKAGLPTPVLVLPDGSLRPLTVPVIVGREPTVKAVDGKEIPVLVALPGMELSRSHALFEAVDDTVVVTDLRSQNGTIVVMPGKPPQRLRAGEPTVVVLGTIVDFGGGLALTVEER